MDEEIEAKGENILDFPKRRRAKGCEVTAYS